MSSVRPYNSSRRADAAQQTRRRIIAAARQELLERGYQATTITALARRAGVSQQTIYNSVGSKAAVLKAVYDAQLAGDDEPIAMKDRPEFKAVQSQRSVAATLRAYAAMSRMITGRAGALLGAVFVEGPGSDAELRAFLGTIDRERRAGNMKVVTLIGDRFGLPKDLSFERAVDAIWTLTAPEIADRLVRQCHWSLNDYETWLASALINELRPRP